MTGDASARDRLRWLLLGALLLVTVASLVLSAYWVAAKGEGGDPVERVESLQDGPGPDPAVEREQLLALGREFVVRFNTYGPDMLEEGRLPEYASLTDLMSAKFAEAFEDNVGYAEQTVAEVGVGRSAEVFAVGIVSQDADSAELLVGGNAQFSYPSPQDEEERVEFDPQRFRYQVSLVRIDGEWVVDDLDDVDDGLPSLADATIEVPPGEPTGVPTEEPGEEPTDDRSPRGNRGGDR